MTNLGVVGQLPAFVTIVCLLTTGLSHTSTQNSQRVESFTVPRGVTVPLPIDADGLNEAFSKIADYGRVPIGLEIAGDVMPRRRTAAYSLDLAGLTWSALFTLLDRYQSGHEVTFMKGVPVVRPFGAANLDASLLNRRVEKFAADGRSLDDVLFDLMAAIEPDFRRPSRRPSPERFRNRMPERYESIQEAIGRRITLKLSGVSVVEVLNAVVEEHGGIWWRVRRQSATTSFELRGFDGWGFGVELKTGL